MAAACLRRSSRWSWMASAGDLAARSLRFRSTVKAFVRGSESVEWVACQLEALPPGDCHQRAATGTIRSNGTPPIPLLEGTEL